MIKIHKRYLSLFCAALCVLLLGVSLYFEQVMDMSPCLLCLLQRMIVIALGLLFILAALFGQRWRFNWRIYAVFVILLSSLGLLLAGRHVWLQAQGQQSNTCLPGFHYMVQNFSLVQIVRLLIEDAGQCTQVAWEFMGLSIPAWLVLFFSFFLLTGIWIWTYVNGDRRR